MHYMASWRSSYDTPLVGFFLDGVALDEKLMQADGIHPTAAAQPRLLDNLWPALQPRYSKNEQESG